MKYTGTDGKEYDTWSDNETIRDKFVGREVMCCMTSEVEFMLRCAIDGIDDCPFDENDYYDALCSSKECECGESDFEEILAEDLEEDQIEMDTEYVNSDPDDETEKTVYTCPTCETTWDTVQEAKDCCENEQLYRCTYCGKVYNQNDYNDLDIHDAEVYEWWAVTGWFGDKLKGHGEIVIESYGKSYWGRCCTGQAISLDGVIGTICYEMGILKGQEYDWSET